jgi:dephospho-CoA kinase
LKQNKEAPFVIKEVAILFETNGQDYCYATILVTAPLETRIQRVLERDTTTKDVILKIIKNQLPEEQKIRLATYVVENENLEKTYEFIDILIKKLNNI